MCVWDNVIGMDKTEGRCTVLNDRCSEEIWICSLCDEILCQGIDMESIVVHSDNHG